MKKLLCLLAATLLAAPLAHADDQHHRDAAQGASQASGPMADGEIRKVDKDAKKITIKHGPLVNLDMPPMTMVFQVKDRALLDKVKAGDRVKFQAQKIGGAFTVTELETAK